MSESTKKKSEKGAHPVDKSTMTLRHLMLDQLKDKYRLVPLAVRWAHEIRQRDQITAPMPELINLALKEILSDKVTLEEIEKLPPPKIETKAPLAALPDAPKDLKESDEKEEKPKKSKE